MLSEDSIIHIQQAAVANVKAKVRRMILSFMVDHERVLRNVVRMSFDDYHYTVFILDEIRHFMSIPNSQKTRLESFMEDF